MPANLYIRSTAILFSLWGLMFAMISTLFYFNQDAVSSVGSPLTIAMIIALLFVFLQFLISPFLMDWILGWVYKLSWVDISQLPEDMAQALIQSMDKHNFSISKIGIIHDQMPNAFTYGHFKKNARIVFTEGIIDLLNSDERVAVLEHEVGHIVHHDFIFMTIAQAVPLMFYLLYITTRSFTRTMGKVPSGKSESSAQAAAGAVMVISYIFYVISGFVVLFLSRTRESYADHFSAVETRNPNAMSTALVKVGYGLVQADAKTKAAANDKDASNKDRRRAMRQNGMMKGMRSMGLADVNTSKGLVTQAYVDNDQELHPDAIAAAASWDLNSPWAKFVELNSTHPLTGKRLRYLDQLAPELGQQAKYPTLGTIRPDESLWDEFLVDLMVYYLFPVFIFLMPLFGAIYASIAGYDINMGIGIGMLISAMFWYFRVQIRYPKAIDIYDSPDQPVNTVFEAMSSMEKDMYYEASPVRGKPIKLVGTVIGRGTPGYYLGEDFVVRDDTGIMVIDFSSLFGWIGNIFFGWRKIDEMIGQEITVIGWYRRSIRPYVQLHRAYLPSGDSIKNYWRFVNLVFVGLLAIIGLVFLVI